MKKLLLQIISNPDLVKSFQKSKNVRFIPVCDRNVIGKKGRCFPALKYLDSSITGNNKPEKIFSDITKLSELESLEIQLVSFGNFPVELLKQLQTSCPKLRSVTIGELLICADFFINLKILYYSILFPDALIIKDEYEFFLALFSIPQLESIKCSLNSGFSFIDIPEPNRLLTLRFTMYNSDPIFTGFFKIVRKISGLKSLQIDFVKVIDGRRLLLLVCGVAVAATSVRKDVVVSHLENKTSLEKSRRKLKITRSSTQEAAETFETDGKVLQLTFNFENEETLFNGVTEFVQNKLQGYHAFVLKNEK